MQEIERIHPGACVYTASTIGQYKNTIMYMSNFSVVLFQLEPFKYLGSIQAPYDLQLKGGQERSGLAAIAVNQQGQLSVCTRLGTLLIYDLPQFDQPVKTVSLDYKRVNRQVENRAASNLQIQVMQYHPVHGNILFAYEQYTKEIMVLNIQNCRIFSISTPDYINALQVVDDFLLIGSALEGSYQVLENLGEFLKPIFTKDEAAKGKVSLKYIMQEQLLGYTVMKDTIFTTSPLQWYNINYETCFSLEQNPTAQAEVGSQVLSCWYGGTLRLHGLSAGKKLQGTNPDTFDGLAPGTHRNFANFGTLNYQGNQSNNKENVTLLGERRINDVICACFVAGLHGTVALGTKGGKIIFCSLAAVLRQGKVQLGDKKLERELENLLDQDTLTDVEMTRQVIISRFGQIITMKSAQLTIKGTQKIFLYGIVSSGGLFIYEFTTNTIVTDGAVCGHTESIFSLQFHPTISGVFATSSSDATVKIWRKSQDGIILEQQFGQTGFTSQSTSGQQKFVFKNNNSAKSGGQIDSQALTGSILSAAWDPRDGSCLMALGGWKGAVVVCDVWRSTIYSSLPSHNGKVHDIKWQLIPGLSRPLSLICTVGSDGVARIFGVDFTLRIQSQSATQSENTSADPRAGPENAGQITATGLQLQRLETNYVEFANNPDIPITGCAFSPHEPLLATACRDGYVRVYDLRPFDPQDDVASKLLKAITEKPSLRRPIQIGKFSVSQKPLFHIIFHPKMKNVLAMTSDTGEVRVYRYEFDGEQHFKVQCASILMGHKSASRPLHFSCEVPQILFTGSWDGQVIAWNWVHNVQLARYQMGSDVYGLGGPPSVSGLEIYASSRDLSIRRLFLSSIAQQLTARLVFLPLSTFTAGSLPGALGTVHGSGEAVRRGLRGVHNIQLTKHLRSAIMAAVQTPSYRKMRDEAPEQFILTGKAAENLLINLSDDSPALEVVAEVAKITFPAAGGAEELLRTVLYFQQNHDADLYVDDIMADRVAYDEHEKACNGLVLSARSLQHMAAATGLHYMRALFGLFEGRIPEEFKKKKYGFYQYQRKLPNVKADAYKYQFKVGLIMLAAAGMYAETAQVLTLVEAPERVFYENLCAEAATDLQTSQVDPKGNQLQRTVTEDLPAVGAAGLRGKYAACLSRTERQVLAAVGVFQSTGSSDAIRDLLPTLCREGLHAIAKLLAYLIRSERLIRWVSREASRTFISSGQPVRAALELCSSNQVDLASRALSLSGEPFLASLLSLASPEEGFPLSLVGAAEICFKNGLQPQTLMSLARGVSQSAPKVSKFTGFLNLQQIQTQFRQLCSYGETFQGDFLTESQMLESASRVLFDLISGVKINFGVKQEQKVENQGQNTENQANVNPQTRLPTSQPNETVSKLLSLPPERFYDQVLTFMEPQTLQALMGLLGGETVEERFSRANLCLLSLVNAYIRVKGLKPQLFTLYNLFRYKSIGLNDVVYEAAFLSNYLAAQHAATTLQLDHVAAFLFSQAEKIQAKFNVCSDIQKVKLLKLEAVYRYSGQNETVKTKILQIDPKWNGASGAQSTNNTSIKYADNSFDAPEDAENDELDDQMEQITHDMDVYLSSAIGAQKLRSLLSPFNVKLQTDLNFCPTADE